MRAIVFAARGQVELWDTLALPALGDEEVEVRTLRSGVTAGTEKNLLLGGNYAAGYPCIPGYQQVGRVSRAGPGVRDLAVGQRVYAHFWGRSPAGIVGEGGAHVASRVGPASGNLLPLPDDLPDEEAALLSVASIGLHAVRRAGVGLGQRVLVLGLGIIGQFAAQAARALGGRAVGVDRVPLRLDLAARLGCEATIDGRADDAWDRLALAGPFDAVIETTGLNDLVGAVLERRLLIPRGALVMVGGRFTVEYPFNLAQRLEAAILHTSHHTNQETAEVIRLRRAGLWHIAPLITHRVRPDQAPEVWRMILADDPSWLGIVYDWEEV